MRAMGKWPFATAESTISPPLLPYPPACASNAAICVNPLLQANFIAAQSSYQGWTSGAGSLLKYTSRRLRSMREASSFEAMGMLFFLTSARKKAFRASWERPTGTVVAGADDEDD